MDDRVTALEDQLEQLKACLDYNGKNTVTIRKATGSQDDGTLTFHQKLEIHRFEDKQWGEYYPVIDRKDSGVHIYGEPKYLSAEEVDEYREKISGSRFLNSIGDRILHQSVVVNLPDN